MTPQEQVNSEANKYVMPAVEDYLATRCLLLNNIFVGLILAHEAIEKIMKALLVLESVNIPKSCHDLNKLSKLLSDKNSTKYEFLKKEIKFIDRLDTHYAWRYYDGNINKRSKTKSPTELHPIDKLWIALYECYMNFLPEKWKFSNYLIANLFAPEIQKHTTWSQLLSINNRALKNKTKNWKDGFDAWYRPSGK
ncbi:hypothetical protein A3D62_02060 [Candidatus Kaiserbacteria bacterium RIFCSPHIGHO2_02_FULL_49_11]|uniref:HEPN domain-containing protein n=1 Tax=Candidatus Kaiserbacteria bacterium RIFCSPHIGHO2_02_FULL_49_11 TaxID=1798489 RepID=A0A1F6D174_9BACT|nr:MAG: hypothetical protein A3D62_02060 [Candidatus Kaiserbacteria bacterium RIFCSPHIGHO2_02_FULL_49_11]